MKFRNYKEGDMQSTLPGFANNAWITPTKWIDIFPSVVGAVDIGNRKTIDESIIYVTDKGSIAVYCAPRSVEGDGEMIGEPHAKRFRWTPKIVVVGDGPVILDMMENIINTTFLLHVVNGECESNQKIQYGNKCTPCIVNAGSFKSGTLADGRKQFEFEFEAFDKYFYNGTIVELDSGVEVEY